MVGRVAAEKNVELGLRAFELRRERRPDLRMVVVGDGPARARLEAAHPEARFVGVQRGAELAAHYASADVFLFPSLSDTFGNVVMEALASGLPVVAFDSAAAAEHVADGVSGRLVSPGDERRLRSPPWRCAEPRRLLATMRDAAVAAARRATWDEVLARFEARLQDTVDALETPPAAAFPSWPDSSGVLPGSSASARSRSGCTARRRAPGSSAPRRGQPRRRRLALVRGDRRAALGRACRRHDSARCA